MSQDQNNAIIIQNDDQLDQSYLEGKNNDRFENNASSGLNTQSLHDSSLDTTNANGEELAEINKRAAAIHAAKKSGENLDETNEISAAKHAANDTNIKQASTFRDPNRQPARANEATDRNDTGSGGLSAGGVKSGSSLQ